MAKKLTYEELEMRVKDLEKQLHTFKQESVIGMIGTCRDITDRKWDEKAISISNERFSAAFHCAPSAIIINSLKDGRFKDINDSLQIHGFDRDEIIGHTAVDLNLWANPEQSSKILKALEQNGGMRNLEVTFRRKSGELGTGLLSAVIIDLEDEPCVLGLLNDITELKHAEDALRESERKSRAIFDQTFQFIGLMTTDGTLIEANRTALSFAGIEAKDVLGKPFWETTWWAHSTELQDRLKKAIRKAADGHLERFEAFHPTVDGNIHTLDFSLKPVKDEAGNVIFLIPEGHDITKRKQAEDEMQRLRNLLKNIVDSMPSILIGVNLDGKVTQWNKEAERVTGVKAGEAQGKALESVFPSLAGEMEEVRQAMKNRTLRKETKVFRENNGEARFSDVTVYPLVANGIEGAVIRVDDVTERVRIEEMMIQNEKMLSVGGLAAGMAHEINTPLAGIIQNVQVINNRLTDDTKKNRSIAEQCGTTLSALKAYMDQRGIVNMIESVMESGKRAAIIVNNMLSFSRKSESILEFHNLGELLDKTIDLASSDYDLKKKYDFRQIEIVREYNSSAPQVMCESSKIQQVFLNILKNGAHAMVEDIGQMTEDGLRRSEKGSVPRFTLRVMPDGEMARIEIKDNGPGMDEETRKRVFEPFFTTKEVGIGTGLGLSVSYFIITENHGGTIEVKSAPGKGAKFIIRLPFDR